MKRDPIDPWTCPPLAHSRQWLQNKGTLILSRCCASLAGTRRHTYVHMYTWYCASGGSQYGSGTVGMQVAAGIQGGRGGIDAHTPQCCNPEILMLCAMAHCRAPWQFTSSLRHTQAGDTGSTYIEFHFVIVIMYVHLSCRIRACGPSEGVGQS